MRLPVGGLQSIFDTEEIRLVKAHFTGVFCHLPGGDLKVRFTEDQRTENIIINPFGIVELFVADPVGINRGIHLAGGFPLLHETIDQHGVVVRGVDSVGTVDGVFILPAAIVINQLLRTFVNLDVELVMVHVSCSQRTHIKAAAEGIGAPVGTHDGKARPGEKTGA